MERVRSWKKNWTIQKVWERYSTLFLFIIVAVLFSIHSGDLLIFNDFKGILLGNTALMIVVLGLTFVVIVGGIDLSVGYQISLVSVMIAMISREGFPDWIVVVGALTVGVLCGLMNGTLVAFLNIVPFAATIATQIIFRGVSYYLSNGSMTSYRSDVMRGITRSTVLGIREDLWLMLFALLIFIMLMHFSFLGKYMRAIGLHEESAERAGVRIKSVKCFAYALAGLFYAVAAIIMTSAYGYAGSEIGIGMEITGITAAYIGGALWQAQQPNVVKLIFGVLIVSMIENKLPKVGINSQVQYIITGLILVVAMGIHGRRKQ